MPSRALHRLCMLAQALHWLPAAPRWQGPGLCKHQLRLQGDQLLTTAMSMLVHAQPCTASLACRAGPMAQVHAAWQAASVHSK